MTVCLYPGDLFSRRDYAQHLARYRLLRMEHWKEQSVGWNHEFLYITFCYTYNDGEKYVSVFDFPPDNQPHILHLVLVVESIRSIGPRWEMLGAMSCWYARSVYEVLKAKFGGREEATRHASDRGTYMSRTLVRDDLRFDLPQLSSDVLRESVIRAYPQRIGWLWHTSTSGGPDGIDSPAGQALVKQLEEDRATLGHDCPEVFYKDDVASSPACPGRQAFIRPVQELIEGIDNIGQERLGEECRKIDKAEQGMRELEGSPGANEAAQRSRLDEEEREIG
ncbi:hypothetical protein K523DRAFT_415371 [Schizophyllum commune Tattone D]|nr:hypothetical protein K523DRAFT_415371 [Schizophyllum commune Tattone D]